MRTRLIGFIPLGKRLLNQQRDEELEEVRARTATRPKGNVQKIDPATVARPGIVGSDE